MNIPLKLLESCFGGLLKEKFTLLHFSGSKGFHEIFKTTEKSNLGLNALKMDGFLMALKRNNFLLCCYFLATHVMLEYE